MTSFKPLAAALGSEVVDIDLSRPVGEADFRAIERTFDERSVLLLRGQDIDPGRHIEFSRRFGDLEIHVLKQFLLPGHPEILVVSNMVENGVQVGIADAGQQWHTDLSYVEKPSRCSLLYARIVPPAEDGRSYGDTCFVSTSAAYDALDPDMQAYLGTLKARHSYYLKRPHALAKLSDEQRRSVPEVVHPVVRTHPATGRKCLYINESFTTEIIGLDKEESDALLQHLCEHCRSERFMYRHRWQAGDLLMWDNCSTQHLAVADYGPHQHRYMHRTTVRGGAVF